MNTKIIMSASAIMLGIFGIVLTFLPLEILIYLDIKPAKPLEIGLQILGALYFAFAMLNWMTKSSMIGGIYNRPVAVANFSHFMIGGLALTKSIFSNPDFSIIWLVLGLFYTTFALIFGIILFRNPAKIK